MLNFTYSCVIFSKDWFFFLFTPMYFHKMLIEPLFKRVL